jgi:hypothetical protein
MASSYTRPCRTCQRRISMRQMPHGQWVAFENDEPHNCSKPPKVDVVRSTPRKSPPVDAPTEFDDIIIPGDTAPQPAPIPRPVEPPQTAPLAPAPAKQRPSPGLTNLRSHPATDVNRSLAGRRDPSKPEPTVAPTMETPPRLTAVGSTGWSSGGIRAIFAVYVLLGVLHSIAFTLFVSRVTCATTTKTLVSIFCNTGMGISHFITVLGWPWYWL